MTRKTNQNNALEQGKIYHIYHRSNSGELLFYQKKNYEYFLTKYYQYLSHYVDTLAYCLMPNHFHLMISCKTRNNSTPDDYPNLVAEQFRKLFIPYAQAINKQEGRRGSLFQKSFKRSLIDKTQYLTQIIFYIHYNPVHHGFVSSLADYQWSSYKSIIYENDPKICSHEVIKWFGGIKNFITFHQNYEREKLNRKLN